jgi:2'-5' RNA ligase
MKRTFIAVDISDAARLKAASYTEGLRREFPQLRVGWERPEKLHLTLKFLGDVNEETLQNVQRAVREVVESNRRFQMALAGTGKFPPKGDPRILWLGGQDNGQFAAIALQIERELTPMGFEPERRGFSPHLTIARLREPRRSANLGDVHLNNDFGPVGFEVREIVIYESKLLPKGSVYGRVAGFPLKEKLIRHLR